MASKNRAWCFTINNYTNDDILAVNAIECKYKVWGKEIGEQGTPHLQGYIYFKDGKTRATVSKMIKRANIRQAKGSAEQNRIYCTKDNDFVEEGIIPKQGCRNDLNAIKDDIMDGRLVDDIVLENPILYHQYGRTLNKIEDLRMRKLYRTEMTTCEWLYGKTGVGKSHEAFANYNPETHYVWKLDDNGWQDGYTQQETVIINDFRGEIKYNDLLKLVDKWPEFVKRRNREPMPFISKHIIITSSLHPKDIYKNRQTEDKLQQLLRRISIRKLHRSGRGNNEPDHK